ncbi:hypothetical protein JCM18902_2280 [Psychrobacter sp. JCM 18902]|nr:hypothetical protein JCM18902_2280 [Psychrobacter sp. JCM 18902]
MLEDKKMSLFQTFIQKIGIVVLVLGISGSVLAADFKSIQASAESGDVNAQLELAERYEALEKSNRKVVNFEPQELYYEGKAVDENAKEALSWYLKAANQGNAVAQAKVGGIYHDGRYVKLDYSKAFEWYQKAIKENVAEAQFGLGLIYAYGNEVPKDPEKSQYWLTKAAEQNYVPALFNLAYEYHGHYDDHESQIKALELFKKMANGDDPNDEYVVRSQYALGSMYYDGYGTEEDYHKSAYWYQKAAEHGLTSAQTELARMYSRGEGVDQSHDESIKWYKKAANQGSLLAQTGLAMMYYDGEDVAQDYTQAFKWLNKIVESGKDDYSIQLMLASLYLNGDGVTQNDAEATKWYAKACQNGNRYGCIQYRELTQ